ncbi:hypothetical protein [Microbacterium pumilum]|uniref:Uncharacterized protein n=1 Tax=Microbacterium pumilum TaxID=344165 RepID=A0ABN2SS39_9MICO
MEQTTQRRGIATAIAAVLIAVTLAFGSAFVPPADSGGTAWAVGNGGGGGKYIVR